MIAETADAEDRVVVTKDRDFRDSHLLRSNPRRLLIVATGNISNNELIVLFAEHLEALTGVYRLATFPHRHNDELMVAVLWTGKRGVIAGQTALGLYELCDVNPRRIDIVVPVDYRPRKAGGEQYRVHHARLGSRDTDIVDDIPVVVPEVAIAQAITAHIDPRLVEQAITTGRRHGHIDLGGEQRLREQQSDELNHPPVRRALA